MGHHRNFPKAACVFKKSVKMMSLPYPGTWHSFFPLLPIEGFICGKKSSQCLAVTFHRACVPATYSVPSSPGPVPGALWHSVSKGISFPSRFFLNFPPPFFSSSLWNPADSVSLVRTNFVNQLCYRQCPPGSGILCKDSLMHPLMVKAAVVMVMILTVFSTIFKKWKKKWKINHCPL